MTSYETVIAGGGMVAGYIVKTFAERGWSPGRLAIISADDAVPYERPPLSKSFLLGKDSKEDILINQPDFYREHGVELRLQTNIAALDTHARILRLEDGEEVGFERLVIATGSVLRKLHIPGSDLAGIHYLRSIGDSAGIRDDYEGKASALVLGGGFIGMEVASVLARRGPSVTMAFPEQRVWQHFFTPEMSAFFEDYYRQRGVVFAPGTTVVSFAGDGRVASATLDSGRQLPADIVVAGIGVTPAAAWLEGSGIEMNNGVVVNDSLETNIPGIFAAGDMANYYDRIFQKRRRVEHWDNAVEQAKYIAAKLHGEAAPFEHVPYFFSDVFDLSYEFWGDTEGATETQDMGEVASGSFSTWWLRDGRVVAAFVMNRPDEERDLAPKLIAQHRGLPANLASSVHASR